MKDKGAILDSAFRTTATQDADGNILVNHYQDVEPALDYCADKRRVEAEGRGAFGRRNEFHHTMSIPFNVLMGISAKLGIPAGDVFDTECQRRIVAEAKKAEYKLFRVTNDKLI